MWGVGRGNWVNSQDTFEAAYKRVSSPSSYYWSFWDPDSLDFAEEYEVEVRFNVSQAEQPIEHIPDGWVIDRQKPEMLFLRRRQKLNKLDVENLFADALRIALERNWTFHSWVHNF